MGITICEAPRNIVVRVLSSRILLSRGDAKKVTLHCEALIDAGLDFEDGTVYHRITDKWDEDSLTCEVYETTYRHYLYSKEYEHNVRFVPAVHVIHTATFLITNDGYVILGEMASSTANAGGIQAIGGTLDQQDLQADGTLDLSGNVTREMSEEVGISTEYKHLSSLRRQYVVHGGSEGKIAIVYLAHLVMDLSQFKMFFSDFQYEMIAQGKPPEFEKVYPVKLDPKNIDQFIEDEGHRMTHYVALVLRKLVR